MRRILAGWLAVCLLVSLPWLAPKAGAASSGTITFNPNAPVAEPDDTVTFNPNGSAPEGSGQMTLDLSVNKDRQILPFLTLEEIWGLTFQEIMAMYPGYVIERKETIVTNKAMPDYSTSTVRADRYVLLGWSRYGCAMVLCESKGKGSECTIGYTTGFNINEWTRQADRGHVYPDYHPDEDAGLPARLDAVTAVALQDIKDIRYSDGYWFDIDFRKNEKLIYMATVETGSGKFDYVQSMTGRRGKTYNVFIPHGLIQLQIPVTDCEVTLRSDRYGYTGEVVRPDVEVRFRERLLTEGEDYEILSDSSDPGSARAVIRGMGYFSGESRVDYTICHTSVILEEIRPVVEGESVSVTTIIWTTEDEEAYAGAPSAETVAWDLDGTYVSAEWQEQIMDNQPLDYRITRKLKPEKPGEYTLSVMYNGVRAAKKFIVEPRLSCSIGPLREDGTLVEGKNRETVSSYTDMRLSVDYDERNVPFLCDFLKKLTEEHSPVNGENTEISGTGFQTITLRDDEGNETGKTLSLVFRVRSTLPENEQSVSRYRGWFEVMTPAWQHIYQAYRISNGILAEIGYRSELQAGEKKVIKSESYLPAKEDSHLFYFDDRYFYNDSDQYQNSLAVMSLGLEMASYSTSMSDLYYSEALAEDVRARNLVFACRSLGFSDVELHRYAEPLTSVEDNVAYSFGTKYISSAESDDTLVAVVIRGGGYGAEWVSNFNVGKQGNHAGFEQAARDVENYLEAYTSNLKREHKIIGSLKLWITGFSRAGAVANLLGEKLLSRDGFDGIRVQRKDTFIYTFATPSGHYGRVSGQTGHIFNVVSPNDLVPKMAPEAWNYHRNGTSVRLPALTAEAVSNAFRAYRGEELDLSNTGFLGDALIDAMVSLYPDTEVFSRQAERFIRRMEAKQYQTRNGSFVTGFILGLTGGLFADTGEALMTSSFWDTYKILLRLGWDALGIATGFTEGGFIRAVMNDGFSAALLDELASDGMDTIVETLISTDETSQIISRVEGGLGAFATSVTSGIYTQLVDDEEQGFPDVSLNSFSQAHYPEHYLAWLETGGIVEIRTDQSFALMDNVARETVHRHVFEWIE